VGVEKGMQSAWGFNYRAGTAGIFPRRDQYTRRNEGIPNLVWLDAGLRGSSSLKDRKAWGENCIETYTNVQAIKGPGRNGVQGSKRWEGIRWPAEWEKGLIRWESIYWKKGTPSTKDSDTSQ